MLYGPKSSTYKMAVQVSYCVLSQVQKKGDIQSSKGQHKRNIEKSMQVERSGDYRGTSDVGSHTYAGVDPAKVQHISIYGVLKREKRDDDL